MTEIDVHMLVLGSEREDWKAKALASIPADLCRIHIVDGIRGDLGRSRVNGYRRGDHDLVSFVDPDDWIEAGTFERCLDFLSRHPARGVVTQELVYDYFRGEVYRTAHKHGLTVYRRQWIEGFHPKLESGAIKTDVQISVRPEIVQMPFVGRHWRKHVSECFQMRREAQGLPRAVAVVKPEWD